MDTIEDHLAWVGELNVMATKIFVHEYADKVVVWSEILDDEYRVTVYETHKGSGELRYRLENILDNRVLMDEHTTSDYPTDFGADWADIDRWEVRAINFLDPSPDPFARGRYEVDDDDEDEDEDRYIEEEDDDY